MRDVKMKVPPALRQKILDNLEKKKIRIQHSSYLSGAEKTATLEELEKLSIFFSDKDLREVYISSPSS